MTKLDVFSANEELDEQIEAQKILEDAEQIILNSRGKKKSNKKNIFLFIFPLVIFICLILFLSTAFALININNTAIMNGVYIQGIDVSGLTEEEAIIKVSSLISANVEQDILLTHNDFETTISSTQFNAKFDIPSAVSEAYSLGRSGNIFENNYTILSMLLKNVTIYPTISYDSESLDSVISSIEEQLPDKVVDSGYYIDGNSLIITSGIDGVLINAGKFKQVLLSILVSGNCNLEMDIPVVDTAASQIDIEEIYNDIYKEPVNAYYTTDPYVVYPSSNGVDFDISLDEAKELIQNYQEQYTIPLKTLYPEISTNQIGDDAFPDLLSEFSTSFATSNSNRSTNIILAAEKINGLVIMPGETFSYNQAVGQRTKEAGFKEAPAYLNGQVVQEYGGGICQVSSTLYNAVLYANLTITERYNHGFKPSYVKPGLDATVSWGGVDFKFTNNRDYPVRIICDTSGKKLRIYIYGLKTENDYTVVLDAQYLSTIYYTTTYKTDQSLASGETKIVQSGSNGCKTATYKYVYDSAGTLISSECISRDTYNPHNQIIAVGP